jgi:hypothetical protein
VSTSPSLPVPIPAWLSFIEECEQRLHAENMYEVAGEDQVEFNAVYGICAQAIRYAGAYVVLYRAGRSREAVVVGRQALEHALTAQWAHFGEGRADELIGSYHHSRERVFRAVTKRLRTPADEVEEVLASMAGRGKRLLRVTDMIEQIDYDDMFKTAYMEMSQVVHVSGETVTSFMGVNDEGGLGILSEAVDPHERQTAHYTAMAAMFASWLLESLRVESSDLEQLDRLSDELRLPLNIHD